MTVLQPQALSEQWKDRLGLSLSGPTELYEQGVDMARSPHAGAIRTALDRLDASAVFCVQDVPTVVIVELAEFDRKRVVDLHGALWNQGLATLLLVLSGDVIRAYSLARKPVSEAGVLDQRCLVHELDAVTEALAVRNLIYAVESGRLWEEHADCFRTGERIDQVLLNNLTVAHEALRSTGLSTAGAQALLMQTMFIA